MMQGKKILLGVTGSIAAYKALFLVRLLVKEGADVKVIMTPSAKDFVTPLSLATLSRHPVLSDLFEENTWANHVELGRWADLMLIAPLSCNTLGKMAQGLCDNLLMATYLSATCPVVTAPAMDEDMWKHPSTKANLARIQEYGNRVIQVEKGELASGLYGDGRMAEPGTILDYIKTVIGKKQDLVGKRALVTAGPTHEAIDPVRFIGNHSSGKMGIAIAWELAGRGAHVDLVLGPSSLQGDHPGVEVHKVTSAEEMYNACLKIFPEVNIVVMSAAVADFKPAAPAGEKIKKKKEEKLILELTRTNDILMTLGQQKKQQVLVGFALETTGERAYALDKLKTKNADLIVLNSLNDAGAGFGYDTNKVTIFDRQGGERAYDRKPKQQVAADIVDRIVNIVYA